MPAHVRQGVIYRIPTQGKNSMLPIEVVEFTPEAFSTSITLPAAVVTQSGMDYDIDKVYVELKHTSYSRNVFAEGALKAAKWLVSQSRGLYNMENMFNKI